MITPALIFTICNNLVLPQWLLMIVAPKWNWTHKLVDSKIIPVILSVLYIVYIVQQGDGEGGFGSLEGVMHLFTVETIALAGWIHYLAFDLLIGSWVFKKAQALGIHHAWVVLCLPFCFLAGPVGFLLFWIIRKAYRK